MAITLYTRDELISQARTFLRNAFPGKDDHPESFLGKWARVLGGVMLGILQAVEAVDNDAIPNDKTSTEGLDQQAYTFGLPSGTDGEYGRKEAVAATGGVATFTGTNGTVFEDGLTMLGPDGETQFQLDGEVTIPGVPPGTGSVSGDVIAVTAGDAGNLDAGSELTIESPPSGGDGTATLTTALSGGLDEESDAALLQRLYDRLQKPSKGGTANDFKTWCEEADDVTAYIYPQRGGTGTVHAAITQAGTGTARVPSSTTQDAVNDYVNGSTTEAGTRPVTVEGFEVLLPSTAAAGLAIRVRCTPSLDKYAFDWSLGATTFTVASYAAGPPGVITTTQALPDSLMAAVDAGDRPRIQVIISGTVVPVQVRVTAYNSGAKTLTLENPLPSGFGTPAAGNAIYPGGPIVDTIAEDLLDYVDSLGPSRVSGYADELELWEDTCAIYRLAQTALNAEDDDGTRLAKNIIAATIDGSATDVQADDATVDGPELLYAASIAVTD
jgi:hypothetical protein